MQDRAGIKYKTRNNHMHNKSLEEIMNISDYSNLNKNVIPIKNTSMNVNLNKISCKLYFLNLHLYINIPV